MKAMLLRRIVSLDECHEPLERVDVPVPEPIEGEVLIRVAACGVCHTELDEIEGRTAPPALPVIPGHEVVGRIERLGGDVTLPRNPPQRGRQSSLPGRETADADRREGPLAFPASGSCGQT